MRGGGGREGVVPDFSRFKVTLSPSIANRDWGGGGGVESGRDFQPRSRRPPGVAIESSTPSNCRGPPSVPRRSPTRPPPRNSPNKVVAAEAAARLLAPSPAPGMSSPSKLACSACCYQLNSREKRRPPRASLKRRAEETRELLWQLPSAGPSGGW